MNRLFQSRLLAILLFAAFSAATVGLAWRTSYFSALDQLEERGISDLILSGDRLTAELRRYRELVVFLADHPTLISVLQEPRGSRDESTRLMQETADKTGAVSLALVGKNGEFLAGDVRSVLGNRSAVERALGGALGYSYHVTDTGERWFSYAAPVFAGSGPAVGAIVATVQFATLEWDWPSSPNPVFFSGRDGIIIFSNRTELILDDRTSSAGGTGFPIYKAKAMDSHTLWELDGGPYLPKDAIYLQRDIPRIEMLSEILINAAPARRIAGLQASAAAAILLALGAILFLVAERRRSLARKLEIEEAANAALEHRVGLRTAELTAANANLRHEIREREEAEAALRKAQSDLVQAGKLAALGQMSAGISHELNQPLMAIRSYAENAEAFLSRGRLDTASKNLSRISELSRRMGRIIKNLRAFARQESEPASDIDLVQVVEAVLELSTPRLNAEGVRLDWQAPTAPVFVRGGEVRLQQVVMNLVSNALDAMATQPERTLEIAIRKADERVLLSVHDNGPGIKDKSKIFDPFYSTKEVSASEGMGLGLSISYGLVQSFGGQIHGENHPAGGAIFTVELKASGATEQHD